MSGLWQDHPDRYNEMVSTAESAGLDEISA
jgi:hypothetical protein